MTVENVKIIQNKIETKKAELTRAEGRKEQLMTQLKDEFSCSTLDDAQILQEKFLKEIEEKGLELDTAGMEIDKLLATGIV